MLIVKEKKDSFIFQFAICQLFSYIVMKNLMRNLRHQTNYLSLCAAVLIQILTRVKYITYFIHCCQKSNLNTCNIYYLSLYVATITLMLIHVKCITYLYTPLR